MNEIGSNTKVFYRNARSRTHARCPTNGHSKRNAIRKSLQRRISQQLLQKIMCPDVGSSCACVVVRSKYFPNFMILESGRKDVGRAIAHSISYEDDCPLIFLTNIVVILRV